jgi:TPR repeat protein
VILHNRLSKWLLVAVAMTSGCTHVQTNDVSVSPARVETRPADAASSMEVLRGLQYSMGPSKDYGKALVLFRHAAEEGDANGQYNLGQCYEAGHGVEKNEAEAVLWYRKAAEQGLLLARGHLRAMFVSGQLKPVDDGQSGNWWRGLSQQAANESFSFSRAYAAASQGSADAELELGIDYLTGIGVAKDRPQATYLFQEAADQGQIEAQCLASAIVASDEDWAIATETKRAADLCLNAANHGDVNAQMVLGAFYTMGRGVRRDATRAAFWHRKAAEQGQRDAELILSNDYKHGIGVAQDEVQSLNWMRKAADQGNSAAMIILGTDASLAHLTGRQDPLGNPELAKKYLDLGAEHASDFGRELLPNMWDSLAQQERQRQMSRQLRRALAPPAKAMGVGGQ